jgi:hypothetical protein
MTVARVFEKAFLEDWLLSSTPLILRVEISSYFRHSLFHVQLQMSEVSYFTFPGHFESANASLNCMIPLDTYVYMQYTVT